MPPSASNVQIACCLLPRKRRPTNTIHPQCTSRAHYLVPAVYAPYEPSTALEATGAAEGMREGSIGREVLFNCRSLKGGRGFGKKIDYFGDLALCKGARRRLAVLCIKEGGEAEEAIFTWIFHDYIAVAPRR